MKFEKAKIGYLAGLIDGEGTISIIRGTAPTVRKNRGDGTRVDNYRRYNAVIYIANTDRRLINWLISNFGGSYNIYIHKNKPTWKDKLTWYVCGQKAKEHFLLALMPYLVIKREQAKVVLNFLRIVGENPQKRDDLYRQVLLLNQKGKSVTTNTLDLEPKRDSEIIESELIGDYESAPAVTPEVIMDSMSEYSKFVILDDLMAKA